MEIKEVKGGLFLRPMRLMVQGEPTRWVKGQPLTLQPPTPTWPGSVNTDLLRVHWECILRIDRQQGGHCCGFSHSKSPTLQRSVKWESCPSMTGAVNST